MAESAQDRIALAWQFRRAIHAWLVQHPGASMWAIVEAMRPAAVETTRKAVRQLVAHGFLRAAGKQNVRAYTAVDTPVDGERIVRGRLGHAISPATVEMRERAPQRRIEDPLRQLQTSGRYVHRSGNLPALHGQRGQGAGGCGPLGMIALEAMG